MATNYRKIYAIQKKNEQTILKANKDVPEKSGIYILTREDENGFRYAYIGQAVNILSRLANHLSGYNQHIDRSLKSHKFYSEDNPYGWRIGFICYPKDQLDQAEQYYIKRYALAGYQLRNKTSGSQGQGKAKIDDYRPAKGYRDGLLQGRKNSSKEVAHLFDLHLDYKPKSDKPNKNQLKAMDKFKEFLEFYKGGADDAEN